MYESHFQLNTRPFLAAPLAASYFPAAAAEQARESITRCIDRAEGPAVVMGAAGMGKSLLCHVLAAQFRGRFPVAMLATARLCTRRALLQNILFELDLPYRDREEGELRLALIDYLQPAEPADEGILLIVDEAHLLPTRLLEEIRLLTNLVRDGRPRVRLVLAASLLFDERLASPRLESLSQRIAARCYLQPMNGCETAAYVQAQLAAAGADPRQLMAADALQAVYRATGGVPRLVNQVCDHALVLASVAGHAQLEAACIEEAWADLQQLPTPWTTEPATDCTQPGGILEFGELDDELGLDSADADTFHTADATTTSPNAPQDVATQINISQAVSEPAEPPQAVTEPANRALAESPQAAAEPAGTAQAVAEQSGVDRAAGDSSLESAEGSDCDTPEPRSAAEADPAGPTLRDGDDVLPFRPLGDDSPEIELDLQSGRDPFGESFADEEILVDPFASLEVLTTPHSSLASVEETCKTIALEADGPAPWAAACRVEPQGDVEPPRPVESVLNADDAPAGVADADDPSVISVGLAEPGDPGRWLEQDDRDLLEVVEEVCHIVDIGAASPRPAGPVRPYRHLFATLRGKAQS